MQTVGSMLKEARLGKGYTLKHVEVSTKIREKFLEAIERDDYTLLPSISYAKGFVKNYSEFLKLDSSRVLAFFRRQSKDVPKSSLLPPQPLRTNVTFFQLTPTRFILFLVGGIIGVFFLYFFVQYRAIQSPPFLSIESPKENISTNESRIDMLGTTDSDATIVINGVSVLVRGDGKFFDQVSLQPGNNTITIVSTSRFGKTSTLTRTVMRDSIPR